MKLLLLNWQDRRNPQAGGAEAHLHEVFGRLTRRGHSVTLLASGWARAPREERLDGIRVLRTGSRYTFGLSAPRYHAATLAGERFDVVVEALNKVPLFSPLWARAPVVLLVHHLFGSTAFREAPLPLAGATWALERPLPLVYRGIPTQVISESTADDLVARGLRREQIRVIHPGVDLEFFRPSQGRSASPSFVYLGRLRRYKRVDLVLQALRRLREEGEEARLVVAGRGDHAPALAELARRLGVSRAVDFVGPVDEAEKRRLFQEAWAHVLTSPKEGWGMTNVEAAACATPTIASDSPGLRESVREGVSGVLVPHGDVAALARAMHSFTVDRSVADGLGRSARLFAERFTWEAAAEATELHLREVLDAGGALPPTPS